MHLLQINGGLNHSIIQENQIIKVDSTTNNSIFDDKKVEDAEAYEKKQQMSANKRKVLLKIAGLLATSVLVSIISKQGICKISSELSPQNVEEINKAVDTVLSKTKLDEKNVEIMNVVKDYVTNGTFIDKIKNLFNGMKTVAKGKNAFFVPSTNTICVNREKAPQIIFHELGHAYNHNFSNFWRNIQKTNLEGYFLSSMAAAAPLSVKIEKTKEGKELSAGQKIRNSLLKASPYIAAGAIVPKTAEELKASIRGVTWAKESLNKNMASKVVRTNRFSAFCYISQPILMFVFAKLMMQAGETLEKDK